MFKTLFFFFEKQKYLKLMLAVVVYVPTGKTKSRLSLEVDGTVPFL